MSKLILNILRKAVEIGASDLHIRGGRPARARVDGDLVPIDEYLYSEPELKNFIYEILTEEQINQFEERLDLDFSCKLQEICRLRVNLFSQRGVFAISLRIIPDHIPTIEEVYLPNACHDFMQLNKGLVLVTGPTGSGKTTTLASMLNHINAIRDCHILTIEDPIEFLFADKRAMISQREVSQDTGSFSSALRHAFRQDPDVIMIGEMRDLETMQTAITLAETGHLTFSTLHTGEAVQTISRIIDSFPPHQQNQVRSQLSISLEGIISQTLLKLVGKKGRVAAREVLVCTPAVKNMIRENKLPQIRSAIQTGLDVGMLSMNYSLGYLYEKKVISYETAYYAAFNKKEFAEKYAPNSPGVSG